MTDIPMAMSPEEAVAQRTAFVADSLTPYAARVFARFDRVRSAAFCVGQFWCDEAVDAVQYEWVFSELTTPDVRAGLIALADEGPDRDNLPGGKLDWGHSGYPPFVDGWDSNGGSIPLFAAYCIENCDQEMEPVECFVPYAVFVRDDERAAVGSVEITAAPRRPWLDGVAPLWLPGAVDGPSPADEWDEFVRRYGDPSGPTSTGAPAPEPSGGSSGSAAETPSPEARRRWWRWGR